MSAGWGVFWAFANVAAAAVSFAAYSGGQGEHWLLLGGANCVTVLWVLAVSS